MIKLIEILKELQPPSPENIYAPGYSHMGKEEEFFQKGFKMGDSTTDPETGAVSTSVVYLPKFEEIRRKLIKYREEFQPFKFSSNEDIAKLSKNINTNMTKLSQMIFALDKMIELQRKR